MDLRFYTLFEIGKIFLYTLIIIKILQTPIIHEEPNIVKLGLVLSVVFIALIIDAISQPKGKLFF